MRRHGVRNTRDDPLFSFVEKDASEATLSSSRSVSSSVSSIAISSNCSTFLCLSASSMSRTFLGTACKIFARDEYQGDAGNLCHNHLICAVDKNTLNPTSDMYLQDLIRTSAMEIIKVDEDVERAAVVKRITEIN